MKNGEQLDCLKMADKTALWL